jgi:hypothetical protein
MLRTDMCFINSVLAWRLDRTRTGLRGGTHLAPILYTLHAVLWIVHPEERSETEEGEALQMGIHEQRWNTTAAVGTC